MHIAVGRTYCTRDGSNDKSLGITIAPVKNRNRNDAPPDAVSGTHPIYTELVITNASHVVYRLNTLSAEFASHERRPSRKM